MAEFRISVDLSHRIAASRVVDRAVIPLLHQAVRVIAEHTMLNWREAVLRARLWQGEKDAYAGSIKMQMTGDFAAVVWSDYRNAEAIETGRPARDLKSMLGSSLKVRVSKNGRRYLYIPFRHNAPGSDALAPAMPPEVYDLAREFAPSRIVGQVQRLSGTGAFDTRTRRHLTVPQNIYRWGDKLRADAVPRRYVGMYRFDTSTPGGPRHSTYLTFRTMSEGSSGWIVPAKPGLYLARNVAQEMRPRAEQAFAAALTQRVA